MDLPWILYVSGQRTVKYYSTFSIKNFLRNRIKASFVWYKKKKQKNTDKLYNFKIYFKTKDHDDISKETGRH